ncbi:uncharacterized protein LOC118376259 isoform X8 [Oncorhynchus keta]|uniref:uncharacterized protein LOC118376259 isoform X8 n=1 Tax=Oncorhynchus keta TaxID=8018 RepID=UPI00227BB98B|nr:uncharacterized protein LOC118376259 isoform X8 [Oncorhynchus keta]
MYPFSLFVFLVFPYQACLACSPIKKMDRCEDLWMGIGYVYPYETPAGSEIEVYSNNTPIAYRGMNKPFEAHLSDKGKVEECHLYYIVAEREHVDMITINLTDNLTDTSDNTSAGFLVLLLGIAGFLVYRYGNISWRDKHPDNGEPDDPAAGDAESLRSALVIGRDQGDGVEEEREPPHSQETHVESSLLNGHLVNSRQGERGEPSERFVQPMGREGTDNEFPQKRHAGFPLVNGNHKARVNDETKEATPGAQSPGPPQMNGGPPMSDRTTLLVSG